MARWRWTRRRPDPDERDVRDEIASHLALRIEENLARGLTPDDARREAVRRMGSIGDAARRSARIRRRQSALLPALLVDARQALRASAQAPLPSLSAIVVLAIGLGTVCAGWTLTRALLHTPPAGVVRPGELYSALEGLTSEQGPRLLLSSYRFFRVLEEAAPEARLFAWGTRDLQVIWEDRGRVVPAALVTSGYFETLGLNPYAGRLTGRIEAVERRTVCVVSLRLARSLASNPSSVVGQPVTINGQPFEITGIAPRGFHGLEAGQPVDLWLPVEVEPLISTVSVFPDGRTLRGYVEANVGWMRGGVRITPDLSAQAVADRLTAAAKASAPNDELRARTSVILTDRIWISPWTTHRERLEAVLKPLRIAAGVTVVLTSACLASLFLGGLSDRRREFTTRLALGASRSRILRLAAFEMLLVSLAGTLFAWIAAQAMLRAAGPLLLADGITVVSAMAAADARALPGFLGIAALTTLAASAAPLGFTLRLCHVSRVETTRGAAPGTLLRRVLIAGQVAGGCAMLAGAAMLTQSLLALEEQPLGFDARHTAFVELNPSGAGLSDQERRTLIERTLADQPGAPPVAVADELPFGGESTLFAAAEDASTSNAWALPATGIAGPYFETLGIPIVAGRAFGPGDTSRPVVVISATLAEAWWPGRSPLGRIVRIGGVRGRPHEVIGVAAGLRDLSLRAQPSSRFYLPLGPDFEKLVLIARSSAPAAEAMALVDRVRRLDPRLVPLQSGPVERLVLRTLEQRRALQAVSALVGLGSVVMVAAGVWGLSHGTLRRRWLEFGIRQALGATPRQIGRMALRDAWIVAAVGGAAGLAGAWQFGRVLRSWLFGVEPHDPRLLALAAAVVVAAAIGGAISPMRQAMRADPSALLREN